MVYFNKYTAIFLYYIIVILQTTANSNIWQAYVQLSDYGLQFSSYDQQAFLHSEIRESIVACIQKCFTIRRCRTFNYDTVIRYCSLYEGDADTTGLIVLSLSSSSSLYGSIQLTVKDFVNHGQSCSYCENHRYMTCINSTCQCQIHTYFDGSICRSQKLNGSGCSSDIECRSDMNLTCSSHNQCSYMQDAGMSTQGITTSYSNTSNNSTITTSTTTTTTTTTITTTTTLFVSNSSCVNQTWSSSSDRLAEWLFDGYYLDQMNNYNTTPSNAMSFITNGYVKQALVFSNNTNSILTVPYIPIANKSFTIDLWLYVTGFQHNDHIGLFGLCSQVASAQCLHLTLRRVSGIYYLYFGFYGFDCEGVTSLELNRWIHVAFAFDYTSLTQKIYLNGVLENSCTQTSTLLVSPVNVTIGSIPIYSTIGYFQGYMDQMTVSSRTKSACEILEIATLVAHCTFDNGLFLIDSGPNSLDITTQGIVSMSTGRYSQAITFDGSNSSYFQIKRFTALGTTNQAFSISLWIRPIISSGTLVHMSTSAVGTGSCFPLLGFNTNGSLYAQIQSGASIVSVGNISILFSASVWSHIVQTWSSTNGLRLYVNNNLVASYPYLSFIGSFEQNYITLGSTINGTEICNTSKINTSPYRGDLDDFRVYSRELSPFDIKNLYGTGTITVFPYLLTSANETVYAIYKTIAGGSSTPATSGTGSVIGQYYYSEPASATFDGNLFNGYNNFGNCTAGTISSFCGLDTGFYFTPVRGLSLLLSFLFGTSVALPERDPFTITIEGSNSAALTTGSSWILIYSGVTGLSSDPGRTAYGTMQNISNPQWFKSYRFLVKSKRNGGSFSDAARYGEVKLLGY